jgi:hypothetical protein
LVTVTAIVIYDDKGGDGDSDYNLRRGDCRRLLK